MNDQGLWKAKEKCQSLMSRVSPGSQLCAAVSKWTGRAPHGRVIGNMSTTGRWQYKGEGRGREYWCQAEEAFKIPSDPNDRGANHSEQVLASGTRDQQWKGVGGGSCKGTQPVSSVEMQVAQRWL